METRKLTSKDLLSATQVSSVQISPDGTQVLFETKKMLLDENKYLYEFWVVPNEGGEPRRLVETPPVDADEGFGLGPRWASDSARCAYFSPGGQGISVLDVTSGELKELDLRGDLEGWNLLSGPEVLAFGGFSWGADAHSIGFLAASPPQIPEPATNGVPIDILRGSSIAAQSSQPITSFCVIDAETGICRRITGDELSVQGFDFSPDGGRAVVSASRVASDYMFMELDLYSVDLESGESTVLVERDGKEIRPTWSPDGRHVAFLTHGGHPDPLHMMHVGIVPAEGGSVRHLTDEFYEKESAPYLLSQVFWSSDAEEVYFSAPYRMTRQLFKVPRDGGQVERVTTDLDVMHSHFTSDGKKVAFTSETLTSPPDVYVTSLREFAPALLTKLNSSFEEIEMPHFRRVGWRSSDDLLDIEAILVLPPGHQEGESYPWVVEAVGGPSMVSMGFADGTPHPILLFASEGYGVVVPNTRGRTGGYPYSFVHAIETERGHGRGPFRDLMDAVDFVVAEGLADSERLAIVGHSYGAYLTAFAITQTDRFKCAVFHEGSVDDLTSKYSRAASPSWRLLFRQMGGYGSPFDPDEFENIRSQSPIHNMHRAKTPTLIEVGERSAVSSGSMLAHALHFLGIPYEFVIYPRTGHVTSEPLLIKDDIERDVAWINHWIKGDAYPFKVQSPGKSDQGGEHEESQPMTS